ncbi:uncharacterized protein LTR77_009698 [Saxophila tyrrhenica]|uniref:Uncharacterized protein n=1 Tax=Saxophila tyrrhenica TaxID=1690608 RepID=A0AAV9NZS6_9PEZI|nr:hypothetical protein LTR77_009698 [Saxophila tyrrhenica]
MSYPTIVRTPIYVSNPAIVSTPTIVRTPTYPAATASTTKSFPLTSLPGELRNMIYRQALVFDTKTPFSKEDISERTAPLRASHKLREEATNIFLAENHFFVQVDGTEDPSGVLRWVELIGPELAARIKHLTLVTCEEDYGVDLQAKSRIDRPTCKLSDALVSAGVPKQKIHQEDPPDLESRVSVRAMGLIDQQVGKVEDEMKRDLEELSRRLDVLERRAELQSDCRRILAHSMRGNTTS